jgi:formyltetrahydrofolate-dependent phosphoribosylglycinamide formyltransferase|tara:strand:+ start:914 stop:1501 length:588 start_codon:yes stop_codon:yes gene_type:complete
VEKSIGKKLNTSVFISGRGSNLKSLIKYSKRNNKKIKIKLIISDNYFAKGLNFAKKNKINSLIVDYKIKKFAEKKILLSLKKNNINLICLAGYMRILSSQFIKKFGRPILNIHPSLLPKYKGLDTHKKVLKSKDKFTGATVHLVNSKLDAGKIILQKKVRIYKKDTEKSLSKRVLKIEHKLYPAALDKFLLNTKI